jgi:hypothetical protein
MFGMEESAKETFHMNGEKACNFGGEKKSSKPREYFPLPFRSARSLWKHSFTASRAFLLQLNLWTELAF